MSATNHTTNYELPIFVGSDKPAWLVDWNGAMTAIDTAIHTAEGKADQAGTDIGGIESSITTINGTLTSINNAVAQLRIDTNANTGNINTINSLIGNGEPTTTDKTIIGAINEINNEVYDLNLSVSGDFTLTAGTNLTLITSGFRSLVKYLLNTGKSVGKIYGGLYLRADASIPDSSWYTLATFSGADLPTTEAYNIEIGTAPVYNSNGTDVSRFASFRLHFNTSGNVELQIYTTTPISVGEYIQASLPPCVYFFNDLGD